MVFLKLTREIMKFFLRLPLGRVNLIMSIKVLYVYQNLALKKLMLFGLMLSVIKGYTDHFVLFEGALRCHVVPWKR